jgi:leucyl-tRNA synthetase
MKKVQKGSEKYDHLKIEKKWQSYWNKKKLFKTTESGKKPKCYILDMFPYPSGEGLHVGHPRGYIATDVYSRLKRMQGFNVLHPMGWDAFGLPAENYAIKTKTNPDIAVKKNVKRFKDQISIIGLSYDWEREINTTDPKYYKWTQWIFLQLFKKGLAYESYEPVNWCPVDKTVLANEDVEDGKCERCGAVVEKKPMRQWVLKIRDYADRLIEDLDVKVADGTPFSANDSGEFCFEQVEEPGAIRRELPFVERNAITAIVKHWSEDKYLCLKWKKVSWQTFITGGIENGQTAEQAAIAEILEETGYKHPKLVKNFGKVHSKFFHVPKGENRFAHFDVLYFELKDGERTEIIEKEKANHEVVWISKNELKQFITPEAQRYMLAMFLGESEKYVESAKPLLKWPEHIKELQKNWIGRSEGAEIEFKIKGGDGKIKVFTTRPDTLFGVTYVVLAPENKLLGELKSKIGNWKDVEKYLEKTKRETEIDRTDATKEKTGVELSGIKVINPVNGEEVPVFVADYVLGHYGTGAVMAVPAHDDRDFAFAKKYKLPIKQVIMPVRIDKKNPPQEGKKITVRETVHALVRNPKNGKILCVKWKKFPWTGFVVVGVDKGEDVISAAKREVLEETGYKNIKFVRILGGKVHGEYFAAHKDENRIAHSTAVLFDLINEEVGQIAKEEIEKHDAVWIDPKIITPENFTCAELDLWFGRMNTVNENYNGSGRMINSGKFDGMNSEEIKKKITEFAGGKMTTTYKLQNWVFSRQRYWGEPIPVVHCGECAIEKYKKESKLSLNFYVQDVWRAIVDGVKTVETRALNPEEKGRYFGDTKVGDILTLVNKKTNKEKLYRIKNQKIFNNFDELFADKGIISKFHIKNYKTVKDLEKSYDFTEGYVEKIKKNGLIAWEIEPVTVAVPVPEKDLPLVLPKVKSYEPTGTGESPLAAISKWVNTKCPKCGGKAKRETNTMPQWAGSSWYYLRYMDPKNNKTLVDPKKEKYWAPVDMYVGGAEHATRHLIYARFWHKFLYDIGVVSTKEPFRQLRNQGMILGSDNRKMSKRWGNVINPDDVVKNVGADTLRVYESFMGPFEQEISWNTDSMVGSRRFLERVWKLQEKVVNKFTDSDETLSLLHKTIKKVGEDVESFNANTAVSAMMILTNHLESKEKISVDGYLSFIKMLSPFAPHISEEVWSNMGNKKSITLEAWPKYDEAKIKSAKVKMPIQINGKVRAMIEIEADMDQVEVEKLALGQVEIIKWIEGKEIKKKIFVKNKILNFVV